MTESFVIEEPFKQVIHILIIRNWIAYANLLGDFSYKKIVNTSFTSQSIEKRLAGQVEYRQKELI